MKKLLMIAIGMMTLSINAQASHFGEYDKAQIAFANKLLMCPQEVAAIMSEPYTQITEGSFVGGQTPEGIQTAYTIKFTRTMPAPSFQEKVTNLVIRESIKRLDIQAPDAPSFTTTIKCEIK